MAEVIKLVCATDDGINFSKEHFGSARNYLFYSLDLDTGKTTFLEEINNTTPEEKMHGDPEKTKSVSNIVNDAQSLVSFTFGSNIVRMRKKFVPIALREKSIEKIKDVLDKLKSSLN